MSIEPGQVSPAHFSVHRRNMESRNISAGIFSTVICEAAASGKKMEDNDVYLEGQTRQS
jgi:hypothetical protein